MKTYKKLPFITVLLLVLNFIVSCSQIQSSNSETVVNHTQFINDIASRNGIEKVKEYFDKWSQYSSKIKENVISYNDEYSNSISPITWSSLEKRYKDEMFSFTDLVESCESKNNLRKKIRCYSYSRPCSIISEKNLHKIKNKNECYILSRRVKGTAQLQTYELMNSKEIKKKFKMVYPNLIKEYVTKLKVVLDTSNELTKNRLRSCVKLQANYLVRFNSLFISESLSGNRYKAVYGKNVLPNEYCPSLLSSSPFEYTDEAKVMIIKAPPTMKITRGWGKDFYLEELGVTEAKDKNGFNHKYQYFNVLTPSKKKKYATVFVRH